MHLDEVLFCSIEELASPTGDEKARLASTADLLSFRDGRAKIQLLEAFGIAHHSGGPQAVAIGPFPLKSHTLALGNRTQSFEKVLCPAARYACLSGANLVFVSSGPKSGARAKLMGGIAAEAQRTVVLLNPVDTYSHEWGHLLRSGAVLVVDAQDSLLAEAAISFGEIVKLILNEENPKRQFAVVIDDVSILFGEYVRRFVELMSLPNVMIVVGVASLTMMRATFDMSEAVLDAFGVKVAVPGVDQATAAYLAAVTREAFAPQDIIRPNKTHPLLGMPATLITRDLSFHCFFTSVRDDGRTARHLGDDASDRDGNAGRSSRKQRRLSRRWVDKYDMNTDALRSQFSDAEISKRIRRIKSQVGYHVAEKRTKDWFDHFEQINEPLIVFRLLEELRQRRATVSDFFRAFDYSGCQATNVGAVLAYMDFRRLSS